MNSPEWLKPALTGAAVGAIALAVIGFSWGGWLTGSSAQKMASDQSRLAVIAALVPVCLAQSNQDPRLADILSELEGASSVQRRDMVMEAGWATVPGASGPDRQLASACVDKLASQL